MEFNNKKLERTSKFINYFISFILFGFLVALSSIIIDDIDGFQTYPVVENFENKELIEENNTAIEAVQEKMRAAQDVQNAINDTLYMAKEAYRVEKESFDNWLQARETVGSSNEDEAVISRASKLDELRQVEQQWDVKYKDAGKKIQPFREEERALLSAMDEERNRAYVLQQAAQRSYELKVFLIRLLFVLPILLLGVYFVMRKRKHKYWPLFLGFVLFSIYAFFVGLVPYLPSYGGYVRYIVGIVLSIFAGIYAINKIREFVARKAEELKVSKEERSKNVQVTTAEKALDNHMCPSCGKDFIVKKWDKTRFSKIDPEKLMVITDYCRYCGLQLFSDCGSCGANNFAHLPFCASCGDKVVTSKK